MSDHIYLDHNATTPIDPRVMDAMEPYLREFFGNPSSVEHEHGHAAAVAVDLARTQVANAIGAQPNEIVFTGSCTEANNMALFGVARANPTKRHIITSLIEHPAVLEPARALEREGWRVTYLPVDHEGRVSLADLEAAFRPDTVLVSIMAGNNEVGTLQPIQQIGELCASRDVLFHSDLAQVVAYHDIDVARDNIHLASISAHKAYGPKGVGALYIRSRKPRVKITPVMYGGGQERGLRSGTLNTAGIVGLGAALKIAKASSKADAAKLSLQCGQFRDRLLANVKGAVLNGPLSERLPNNLSFSIEGIEPLALIRRLRRQISFSASSACSTDSVATSHVLIAMFGESTRARNAFRVAPGRFTTQSEMEHAAQLISTAANDLLAAN